MSRITRNILLLIHAPFVIVLIAYLLFARQSDSEINKIIVFALFLLIACVMIEAVFIRNGARVDSFLAYGVSWLANIVSVSVIMILFHLVSNVETHVIPIAVMAICLTLYGIVRRIKTGTNLISTLIFSFTTLAGVYFIINMIFNSGFPVSDSGPIGIWYAGLILTLLSALILKIVIERSIVSRFSPGKKLDAVIVNANLGILTFAFITFIAVFVIWRSMDMGFYTRL